MLTENKYPQFKRTVLWYPHSSNTDEYRNKAVAYNEAYEIPNIMITPVTMYQRDDVKVQLYGEADKQNSQFVYYGGRPIKKLDMIVDGENKYKVRSILNYQTHRIIELEAME